MRAVIHYITQFHPTAMDKMIRHLELKCYWNLLDFNGAIGQSLHRWCTVRATRILASRSMIKRNIYLRFESYDKRMNLMTFF